MTIWHGAQYFQQDCICAQQKLRSACASAQSDQSLRRPREDALGAQANLSLRCAQADLSLRWAHMYSGRKCCALAQFCLVRTAKDQTSQHNIPVLSN